MNKLEEIFEILEFTTWDTLSNAHDHGIRYGEDAVTSTNLLALKNARSNRLVLQDTRIDEATKGCDFEFWVGSNADGWHRYAIQAKKLNVRSERYDSLDHKVCGTPQINILETYARHNRAMPLYCLFNHSPSHPSQSSRCPKFQQTRELGCSVTPSATVHRALKTRGARTFQWFHDRPETLPWTCLVRCPRLSLHWPYGETGFMYQEAVHEELPYELTHLFEGYFHPEEILNSEIFSGESDLRPAFIGVIDRSRDDER